MVCCCVYEMANESRQCKNEKSFVLEVMKIVRKRCPPLCDHCPISVTICCVKKYPIPPAPHKSQKIATTDLILKVIFNIA